MDLVHARVSPKTVWWFVRVRASDDSEAMRALAGIRVTWFECPLPEAAVDRPAATG